MTELLSDIRAVQMDDRSTFAVTDRQKALSFCPALSSPLPHPSLKAQLHSFVTLGEKKVFSQDSLQGHILQPFFLGPPKGTGSLVVSSLQQCTAAVSFLFVLG